MTTPIKIIQNDFHKQARGGCCLDRIVRVGDHTIKAEVAWAGGAANGRNEASTWVWTCIGWKVAITRKRPAIATMLEVRALGWNASRGGWHKDPYPARKGFAATVGISPDPQEPTQDCVYDLFNQDVDTLIDMTLAVLGGER